MKKIVVALTCIAFLAALGVLLGAEPGVAFPFTSQYRYWLPRYDWPEPISTPPTTDTGVPASK